MGRQGNFRINYDVMIAKLRNDFRRVEEMARVHRANLSMPVAAAPVDPQRLKQQTADTAQFNAETRRMNHHLRAAANAQRNFNNRADRGSAILRHLGLAFRRMILWWSTAAVLLGAQRLAKEVTTVAAAFQLVVKELTILGTEGEQVYRRLAMSAFNAASLTGRTFEEAADALKGWIRQGYSAIEAADLMRTTLIGLNLTQLSSTELVRTMTAVMRAFNIPASDSISVIDKLVGVSRRYAIETGQLATGIRRFAASAKVANVTLDEQIGIMTAMMVRTQQSAQMVGRAGRTIFTRMRRNATEALETIAKVQVFTDSSQQSFRSMWEVLGDLAAVWKDLTEAEREEIAFQAAGLRQREFFLALMADFQIAQEANIESLSSVGLAYKSNTLLVNTLSKSIAGLKTAWAGVLSQQSGILGFVKALVDGLRGLLDVSVQIPEALIAIGTVLPGLIALGIGLFTAFSPTLLLNLIAVAGAITGLVYAIGKLSDSRQESIIQESKELNDVMIQESVNARTLAGEFINLFEQQNTATDNTDLLIKARDGINRLYPSLLEGEEDLFAVYGILKTSLATMTKRTLELTEARKELIRLELEGKEFEAFGTILEGIAKPPRGFTGGLLEDPENVSASIKTLRQDIGRAQAEYGQMADSNLQKLALARRLLLIMRKDTGDRSEAESDLLATYKDQVSELRTIQSLGGIVDAGGRPEDDVKTLEAYNRADRKRLDTIREYVKWLYMMQRAYMVVRDVREQLNALDTVTRPEVDTDIQKRTVDITPNPELRQSIQKGLATLEEQIKLREKYNQLGTEGLDQAAERVRVERLINDEQIKSLNAQIANTENVQLIAHLEEELLKIQVGSVHEMRLQGRELDNIIRLQAKAETAAEKAARDRERDRLKEVRAVQELNRLKLDFSEAEVAKERAAAAENIKNTLGQVAAFVFLRDEAKEAFDLAAKAIADLSDTSTTQDATAAQRVLLTTFLELQKHELALGRAIAARNRREIEMSRSLLSIKQQESVRLIAMQEGPIAAAEQTVRLAEENLATAKALTGEARKQEDIDSRIIALAAARSALNLANASQQKELSEAELELEQTLADITLGRIRYSEGELAGAEELLKRRREITQIERDKLGADERSVALVQAEIAEAKALENVNKIKDKARIDFEDTMKQLVAERLSIENQNIIAETTLREGKLAGLNKELELLDLAEQEAMQITDEYLRQIALQDIINRKKQVEGDITRTNISTQQQAIQQLIQLAGQQFSAAIQSDFSAGSLVRGLSGVVSTIFSQANPVVSGIVLATGSVLGALFGDPAEKLSDSLERNTNAIDRNTQTLQDVFEQRIGVPTGFALPSFITMQGALPGGGGTVIQQNQYDITIPIDGRGQDAEQIAVQVQRRLDRQLSVNARRGMGTNVLSLG